MESALRSREGEAVTLYRAATAPVDFRRAHRFAEEQGETARVLSKPLVYAERDGAIVSMLATYRFPNGYWMAGPLVTAKELRNPGFTVLRLFDFYEMALRSVGIRQYDFAVSSTAEKWLKMLRRTGIPEELGMSGDAIWFRRILT